MNQGLKSNSRSIESTLKNWMQIGSTSLFWCVNNVEITRFTSLKIMNKLNRPHNIQTRMNNGCLLMSNQRLLDIKIGLKSRFRSINLFSNKVVTTLCARWVLSISLQHSLQLCFCSSLCRNEDLHRHVLIVFLSNWPTAHF